MENAYISKIKINKVRHLTKIEIPLSAENKKHLILTGKNGSGKTSLLDAMADYLDMRVYKDDPLKSLNNLTGKLSRKNSADKIQLYMVPDIDRICTLFSQGEFVVAYYRAERAFTAENPIHIQKVELKEGYSIKESPRNEFIKYLLDLKMTEALALSSGKREKAESIRAWFEAFQALLRTIYKDNSAQLVFEEDTFKFSIHMNGREPFDFNTLSSGYAAILDIVVDLIMRMEKHCNRTFDFTISGIVFIDEIETHLHLELQKRIMELLTTVFPNIQFIVSTHSPFILNSLDNVVIYDLENKMLVENGLSDVPYSGIVEGYFKANEMSSLLKNKYDRYKELAQKRELTDEDYDEIADLELYLNEIPDYLALSITTEYQRMKLQLRNREDS